MFYAPYPSIVYDRWGQGWVELYAEATMTQPCRLCVWNWKPHNCQPCPRLKLIPTSCVISQNWMPQRMRVVLLHNPLILRNLSQVFSSLPPMKAGVPVRKRSEVQPDVHTRALQGETRPLPAGRPTHCVFASLASQTYSICDSHCVAFLKSILHLLEKTKVLS